ncbi:hypothetical protein PRIPAC_86262 [Pristionchus pacificus]|uniref:Uncharacterized protein n=1 Tax=Pristionchus pacificus TaxID=54126 RepID=A0A2A6BNL9_PRIPA|nr:hypothetical protein PRIPAC_86262 [Pristionchus pacificus]|eukprot:PDM67515.1 hypothetical protein PRIPAC_48932 [Pristionchus pacificus]
MRQVLLLAALAAAVCISAHLPAPAAYSTASESTAPGQEDVHTRVKRYYGYGYDYYGGDYWYAGRTIGVIVGVLLLLLCCCIPCICLAGIWFAGWFGIKAARSKKHQQPGNISYIGSRGDTRSGGYGPTSSSSATAAAAAASSSNPISSPPEPTPRTTFAADAQNHRSYTSDTHHQPPPRRFESRRRNSDDFDVVYEAEDHFYAQSTTHSPRETYPYRSSRF